jgi:predicted nucleotidyltransferase
VACGFLWIANYLNNSEYYEKSLAETTSNTMVFQLFLGQIALDFICFSLWSAAFWPPPWPSSPVCLKNDTIVSLFKMKRKVVSFILRTPPALHGWLKETAAKRALSLNATCCSLLDEISTLKNTTSSELDGVIRVIKDWLGSKLLGIVLFGSRARGDSWHGSDYDLLVIVSNELTICRELYRDWDNLRILDQYSPHFCHLPERGDPLSPLFLEASIDGQILYDQAKITENYLRVLRYKIAAGQYTRSYLHGQPVWRSDEEQNISD